MSDPTPTPAGPAPSANGPPGAVIRRREFASESDRERLLKKQIPAWVISGAVHVALVFGLIALDKLMPPAAAAPPSEELLAVVTDEKPAEEMKQDLTNPEEGLEAELPSAVDVNMLADVNVMKDVVPDAPPGIEEAVASQPIDVNPPAGVGMPDALAAGLAGDLGNVAAGVGAGGAGSIASEGMVGRSGATRNALVKAGGGNSATEAAVARSLVWLASQQRKQNGSWAFDGSDRTKLAAATGLAILPFLAAGQTHKPFKENKYRDVVDAGLKFLISQQRPDGSFNTTSAGNYMYDHAIATVALCEAYGMTGDKRLLLGPAQRAINFIVAAQAADGSWGYSAKTSGDTSIVGWQIQALHSAKLCKDITLPKGTLDKVRPFLDKVSDTSRKATYGYTSRDSIRPPLTAVGLLCRYYTDGWGPNNQSMAAGVKYLLDKQQPKEGFWNMYYYYYATQVLHYFDGPEWHKIWNPQMRDLLLKMQEKDGKNSGSWPTDTTQSFGAHVGKLGTTCMALLTLEVYYRHLPLYKRDTAGLRELEMAR